MKSQGINSDRYRWFEDKATGTTTQRPELQRMLRLVALGRINVVVVFKLDRLARNMRHALEVMETLTAHDCRIVATSQGFDFSGPTGALMFRLLSAFSEFENETRKERQEAGIAVYKQKHGRWGRRPNEKRYRQVKRLIDRGLSVQQAANRLGVTRQAIYYSLKAGQDNGNGE
jgi:DNA invertase Pin-like site-specific DNA recombinase